MEASDAFGGGVEVGEGDDPFAGGKDWEGFGADDGAPVEAEPEAASAELPVVDKEGQPVDQKSVDDPRSPLERAEESYQYKVSHGEAVPPELEAAHHEYESRKRAAAAPEPEPEAKPEPIRPPLDDEASAEELEATLKAKLEAIDPEPEALSDPEEQQAKLRAIAEREAAETVAPQAKRVEPEDEGGTLDGQPSPLQQQPEASQEPAEAVSEPEQAPATSEAAPEAETAAEASADTETAPVPDEPRNESGKTTHRRYYVLQLTGAGKFEQVAWYEDENGQMVAKGTKGAKRQTVALSRGTDDALKIGFAALGSPQEGVKIVAVAALHFQPRTVRPKPPEPSKARLEIS